MAFGSITLQNCTLDDNAADAGGALGGYFAGIFVENSVLSNNVAGYSSAIDTYAAGVVLTDSLIVDNLVDPGGAAVQLAAASLTCTGSSTIQAGLLRNSGGVGAVMLSSDSTLEAVACDFGTGADDNSPADIYLSTPSASQLVGDDATLTCSGSSCSP